MNSSTGSRHYNPDWLDDDALVTSFIARQSDFSFLRDELARVPLVGSAQHHLLVGQRGSGKTTLLKRLAVAIRRDADLSDHLIALSFPEELYQVKNLNDFWWAACEALADELERLGQRDRASQLFDAIDRADTASASTEPQGLTTLLAVCKQLERRPVMLIDNLDVLIADIEQGGRSKHKGPASTVYWALRESLSTTTSPVVIGGSVRLSEPFTDHDKAFYDFFLPKSLGRLPLDEVHRVLEHLANQQGRPEVKARLAENPARIETLYELTGGNPRAISLIFGLLQQGASGKAVDDFERLMDVTTPYYKARFEDLPKQARVVMHALAVRRPTEGSGLRFGHTAADIASHADLPTNTVSAQMDVLAREGLVEKSSSQGRTQYRIAEQLFRLWLQMRGSRRVRQNVIGLAEFLEAWFSGEELMGQLHDAPGRAGALLSFAMAETSGASVWRRGLMADGTAKLQEYAQACGESLGDYLPPGDLPADLAQLAKLREQMRQHRNGGLTAGERDALLGSLQLRMEQKAASVEALCQPALATTEAARLRPVLAAERQRLLRYGLLEQDLALLFELRAKGQLPLPLLKPADAEVACATKPEAAIKPLVWRLVGARIWVQFENDAVAEDWLRWGERHAEAATGTEWANVAGAMRRSRRIQAAEQALSQAFKRGDSARAWYERAVLTADAEGKGSEAEAAYRKAIEMHSADAWLPNGLGNLLADKLNRPEEAEAVYRKAIELDPAYAWPWNNLGNLLAKKLNRPDEAEAAYRKAIELDPVIARPWNGLGILLAGKLNRPDEAEVAYRKAIEIDLALAGPWNNLGNLLANQLNRPNEAEVAYRKAIEIDPALAGPWSNLGNLLASRLNRPDEAEVVFRKALELDPSDGRLMGWLAELLAKRGQFEEARQRFEQAAELDTEFAAYWHSGSHGAIAGQLAQRTYQALRGIGIGAARQALTEGLAGLDSIPAALAAETFADELLVPMLATREQARELLAMLRDLGLDRHARPLLLAFEAAIEQQPESLKDLEPEVRRAAQRIYSQLTAKRSRS